MSGEAAWIDLPRPQVDAINRAMSEAHEAFNSAYFDSETLSDLTRNIEQTIAALTRAAAVAGGEQHGE